MNKSFYQWSYLSSRSPNSKQARETAPFLCPPKKMGGRRPTWTTTACGLGLMGLFSFLAGLLQNALERRREAVRAGAADGFIEGFAIGSGELDVWDATDAVFA